MQFNNNIITTRLTRLTVILLFFFSIKISEKGGKKKTNKNNRKVSKDKKSIALKLNNGVQISAKSIYKEDSRVFNINDIDKEIIKNFTTKSMIRVSIMCFIKMVMNASL